MNEQAKEMRLKGLTAMLTTLAAYADGNERALIVIYPNGGWGLHNLQTMEDEAEQRARKRLSGDG